MQFYEFAGENFKKPDEREKEGKDNSTFEIVSEHMQLLQQSTACSCTTPSAEGRLEGATLFRVPPKGAALWVEL